MRSIYWRVYNEDGVIILTTKRYDPDLDTEKYDKARQFMRHLRTSYRVTRVTVRGRGTTLPRGTMIPAGTPDPRD